MADEPDFDVIVIGAGVAGCVAAYQLASAGHSVVLIERGETVGSKNLSGGIMYTHAIKTVFPHFLEEAPIERLIDDNRIVLMNPGSWVGIDYADQRLLEAGSAVSVLRAHLDPWLAEQAEAAGAMVMPGVRVDELLKDASGKVVGVKAGEDELRAHVVIAADGVNSFIARDAGLRPKPQTIDQAVGVKAVLKLDQKVLEDRFNIAGNRGVAYALVGCAEGVGGGGFLYTNKDTISLGVVMYLDSLVKSGKRSTDIFESFVDHPFIDALVKDSTLVEYGCHLVNEGGEAMMGKLVFDGLVIVGDAAGLTLNTGLTIRGMDLAIGSAIAAASGVHAALEAGDTSASGLAGYTKALNEGFVGKDMHTYRRAHGFLEAAEGMYDNSYGELLADILHGAFGLDGTPRKHLSAVARQALKDSPVSLFGLAKIGLKGVRAL